MSGASAAGAAGGLRGQRARAGHALRGKHAGRCGACATRRPVRAARREGAGLVAGTAAAAEDKAALRWRRGGGGPGSGAGDPYVLLGVKPGDSDDDVRAAVRRKLAKAKGDDQLEARINEVRFRLFFTHSPEAATVRTGPCAPHRRGGRLSAPVLR